MSQRLIKPGLSAADLSGRVHPRTGEPLEPIGYINGRPLWPIMGAAPDPNDPDDPDFVGGGDDDDSDDDDESDEDDDTDDEDDDTKGKKGKKPVKKAKHAKDDEDDEDDDDKPVYTQYEYDRVKTRMRKADQRASAAEDKNRQLEAEVRRLKAGKAKDDEKSKVDTDDTDDRERRERDAKHAEQLATARLENAFLRARVDIEWHDPEDALAVGQRLGLFEDVLDEDGTVDRRAMARALKELAKRKPHLVKPKVSDQDDEDDEDEEPAARPVARKMNGRRKGSTTTANRQALENKFPALRKR